MDAPSRMAQALERAKADLDFADALHLGASEVAEVFAIYDMRLIKGAQRLGITAVREP